MRKSCRFACLVAVISVGCVPVGVHEQRLVSRPNMQFSRSAVFNYDSKCMSQILPGLATEGGAQASTCTSCR